MTRALVWLGIAICIVMVIYDTLRLLEWIQENAPPLSYAIGICFGLFGAYGFSTMLPARRESHD